MAYGYSILSTKNLSRNMRTVNDHERKPILHYCLWVALASSLAVNLFLLTATTSRYVRNDHIPTVAPPISPASSWDMIWGEVPTKSVTWQSFSPYSEPGEAASQLWYNLLSPSMGFLRIPEPRQRYLPPSYCIPNDTEHAEIYMTSGVHQLHCLTMVRDYIEVQNSISSSHHERRRVDSHAPVPHLYHCLDYVRQAVICTGDTTLEPVDYVSGKDGTSDGFEIDSSATTRTCRDWDLMTRVMSQFGIEIKST